MNTWAGGHVRSSLTDFGNLLSSPILSEEMKKKGVNLINPRRSALLHSLTHTPWNTNNHMTVSFPYFSNLPFPQSVYIPGVLRSLLSIVKSVSVIASSLICGS